MENIIQQNPILSQSNQDSRSNRSLETSQVVAVAASINLKNLLSYQDVMNAIERIYHLHEGQERGIIMKLWLKGQTMIAILQRFRYLLQDLNIDDKDFSEGLKYVEEKDRNGEIQQLIARAEFNARQYMTALNLTSFTSQAALVKIMPLSSTTKIS
ncbi:unnamed protein product [Rotaria sp. Silwood1]|nr:unnamed protein product [Rotaria sp. Silwood1]